MTFPISQSNPDAPFEIGDPSDLTILFGTVKPDSNNSIYIDPQTVVGIFADYQIVNRYHHDPHTYMAGIASPNGFMAASVAFFQLAAPTLLLISDWTVSKTHKQPLIPSPSLADPNWQYLGAIPETYMVDVASDGVTPLYRISGIYIYGHKNPGDNPYSHAIYPRPPFLEDVIPRDQPLYSLTTNLIDKPTSPGLNNNGTGITPGGGVFPGNP